MITDDARAELYPQPDEVGEDLVWELPLSYGKLTVEGVFLGMASARQDKHNHAGQYPPQGRRCPACRWYEPRLFREGDGERRYVLYSLGCSDLPHETDRPRYRYAADADEAIFSMSTPKDGTRFLTAPAMSMFRMAAGYDPDIAEALERQWTGDEPDLTGAPLWRDR